MKGKALSKARGDVFIGFLPSESNPPTMLEFLYALQCMGTCLLDKILYAVVNGKSEDEYFAQTREHRLSMAKMMASIFDPLVEVADIIESSRMAGEDAAFRLFDLNPDLKFTLVYLSVAAAPIDQADTIDRLVGNIGMRLHGFDPSKHRVVVVFKGDLPDHPYEFAGNAQQCVDGGLFGLEYVKPKEIELPGSQNADEIILRFLRGGATGSALLPGNVAQYIAEHDEYKKLLMEHLSKRLSLQRVR